MKKLLLTSFLLIFILILSTIYFYWKNPLRPFVKIGNHKIYVELALTPAEKQRGLGGRGSMPADQGMIFVYDHAERFGFWMGGMKFPLDFIWISGSRVADLSENIPIFTDGRFTVLQPRVAVNKILEVNAGTIDNLKIQIGDTVSINR